MRLPLLLLLVLPLTGCASLRHAPTPEVTHLAASPAVIFEEAIALALDEGYLISRAEPDAGLLQLETRPRFSLGRDLIVLTVYVGPDSTVRVLGQMVDLEDGMLHTDLFNVDRKRARHFASLLEERLQLAAAPG